MTGYSDNDSFFQQDFSLSDKAAFDLLTNMDNGHISAREVTRAVLDAGDSNLLSRALACTGRVKSWCEDTENRLPVSCTVYSVKNGFTGDDGVANLLSFAAVALKYAAGVAVNLDNAPTSLDSVPSAAGYCGEVSFIIDLQHPDADKFDQGSRISADQRYGFSQMYDKHYLEVEDSLEGEDGLIDMWQRMFWHLVEGNDIIVDFTKVRPEGTNNHKGLVASGPASFMAIFAAIRDYVKSLYGHNSLKVLGAIVDQDKLRNIFAENEVPHPTLALARVLSVINEQIRRGGTFKNGACLSGTTEVLTEEGIFTVEDLVNQPFNAVVNGETYASKGFWKTGEKPLYRLTTDRGYTLDLTADHKLLQAFRRPSKEVKYESAWTELKDLNEGDTIHLSEGYQDKPQFGGKGDYRSGYLYGHWFGDGSSGSQPRFNFRQDECGTLDELVLRFIEELEIPIAVNQHYQEGRSLQICKTQGLISGYWDEGTFINAKSVAKWFDSEYGLSFESKQAPTLTGFSAEFLQGFVVGLFDTDGTVARRSAKKENQNRRFDLKLAQKDKNTLGLVQKILNIFGIGSTIRSQVNDRGFSPEGGYIHVLEVTGDSVPKFYTHFGFELPRKLELLEEFATQERKWRLERYVDRIASIEFIGVDAVYDCTVDEAHEFWANGLRAHNCTVFINHDNPVFLQWLEGGPEYFNWAKRSVYVDDAVFQNPHRDRLLQEVKAGGIFLAKKRWDRHGRRNYVNVCHEISLLSRGTCLLLHQNLGKLKPAEISQAMPLLMRLLCGLQRETGVNENGRQYLSPEEDKQVGLGLVGLSNLLAIYKVKYKTFVEALTAQRTGEGFQEVIASEEGRMAMDIAHHLKLGYARAAQVAIANNMERAFTIAPTANCARNHEDSEGYTLSPEVSPPVADPQEKSGVRQSEIYGEEVYYFHPDCEVAEQVDVKVYDALVDEIQQLMANPCTGLLDFSALGYSSKYSWEAIKEITDIRDGRETDFGHLRDLSHAISWNVWDNNDITISWLKAFMASPKWSTYYRLPVLANSSSMLAKDEVITPESLGINACGLTPGECTSCGE